VRTVDRHRANTSTYVTKSRKLTWRLFRGTNVFFIHGSVHRRWLSRNTNKMHLCNRIYYSKVYWRLNMFRAAHRSSSGAVNCICSLWFIYTCGDRTLSRLSGKNFPPNLDNGRSPHGYTNQRLQIQFRAPDDERCAARNMLNNKFYYKAASCWYSYWDDLLCRLKTYITSIYLTAHTVGLAGRIIAIKSNSEMGNICEEMPRGPDSDIIQQQFSGRTRNIKRM
jgi:hypothetical protein